MSLRRHPARLLNFSDRLLELTTRFVQVEFVIDFGLAHCGLTELVIEVMALRSLSFLLPTVLKVLYSDILYTSYALK